MEKGIPHWLSDVSINPTIQRYNAIIERFREQGRKTKSKYAILYNVMRGISNQYLFYGKLNRYLIERGIWSGLSQMPSLFKSENTNMLKLLKDQLYSTIIEKDSLSLDRLEMLLCTAQIYKEYEESGKVSFSPNFDRGKYFYQSKRRRRW
jgi:hypothetical protein